MHGVTNRNERLIKGRMGKHLFTKRLHKEDTRELKMSGRVRICPMRLFRGVLTAAFKVSGLWHHGHRQFMNPVVREHAFRIKNLDPRLSGLTILHLSDLHLDLDTSLTPILFKKIKDLKYDLAVITGDFNNFTVHMDGTAIDEMAKLIAGFSAPIFGVLGNHDSLRDIPILESLGVRILLNESVTLTHNNATWQLAGIDDPNIFRTHDLEKALETKTKSSLTMLLAHSPSIYSEAAAHNVDIVLCGHTHGGQICLPGGRIILRHIDRGPRHVQKGYWWEGRTQGWTSSGTGSCGIPVRINCPPEIMLHRIVAE